MHKSGQNSRTLFFFYGVDQFLTITAGAVEISLATTKGAPESTTLPPVRSTIMHVMPSEVPLNLNLNSLLVTRQMTLFHQGVRDGGKLVP